MATQEIRISGLRFYEDSIESVIMDNAVSLSGEELKADVLEASVYVGDSLDVVLNTPYGSPVSYYNNENLAGKYYLKKTERTGMSKVSIQATSMIGIFDKENFYGAFYSGSTTLGRALSQIVGGDGITTVTTGTPYYLTPYRSYKYDSSVLGTSSAVGIHIGGGRSSWRCQFHVVFGINGAISGAQEGYISFVAGGVEAENVYGSGYAIGVESGESVTIGGSTGRYVWVTIQYSKKWYKLFEDAQIPDFCSPKFEVDVVPGSGFAMATVEYSDGLNSYRLSDRVEIDITAVTQTSPTWKMESVGGAQFYNTVFFEYFCRADFRFYEFKLYDSLGRLYIDALPVKYEKGNVTRVGILNAVEYQVSGRVLSETSIFTSSAFPSSSFLNPYDAQNDIMDVKYISRYVDFFSNLEYGPGVETLIVRGWIPIGTKRDALYQLLFSQNLCMLKTADGKMLITGVSSAVSGEFGDDEIFDNGSEENEEIARTISLTEHSYEAQGTSEIIFDNTTGDEASDYYIAVFKNAPISGTAVVSGVSPLVIMRQNCNCAICRYRGQISGTPYRHSQRVLIEDSNSTFGADVSVTGATMVTALNSDNVMKKLKAYYGERLKKIKSSIVYGGQRCGLVYSFRTPFGEMESGFITKMSSNASSFLKSECEFVSGYVPADTGGYTNFVILSEDSAEWMIPSGILERQNPQIRINLIGKGYEGSAGSDGEAGESNSGRSVAKGGKGGKGGVGGSGGKIYSVTVNVTSSMQRVEFSSSGYNSIAKIYGSGSTALGTYYSSSGNSASGGFTNLLTGIIYALPGNKGYDGGNGGDGGVYVEHSSNVDNANAKAGQSVNGNNGGSAGSKQKRAESSSWYRAEVLYGGQGGGGASYSSVGGNAVWTIRGSDLTAGCFLGGKGADGGSPAPNNPTYGCGGNGGNGGGGSGGGYSTEFYQAEYDPDFGWEDYTDLSGDISEDAALRGGRGGAGASGNPGCVIIYY